MQINVEVSTPPPVIRDKVESVTLILNREEAAVLALIIGSTAYGQVTAFMAERHRMIKDTNNPSYIKENLSYTRGLPERLSSSHYEGIYTEINKAFKNEKHS